MREKKKGRKRRKADRKMFAGHGEWGGGDREVQRERTHASTQTYMTTKSIKNFSFTKILRIPTNNGLF